MPYHTNEMKKPPAGGNSEKNTPLRQQSRPKENMKKPSKRKPTKKKANNPPSKMKQNIINKSSIHHTQKRRLMEHALHHTKRHLDFMIGKMERGASFNQSHMEAAQQIGN